MTVEPMRIIPMSNLHYEEVKRRILLLPLNRPLTADEALKLVKEKLNELDSADK
jgi:hypothetical protein